jgi:hypothetical protein
MDMCTHGVRTVVLAQATRGLTEAVADALILLGARGDCQPCRYGAASSEGASPEADRTWPASRILGVDD